MISTCEALHDQHMREGHMVNPHYKRSTEGGLGLGLGLELELGLWLGLGLGLGFGD